MWRAALSAATGIVTAAGYYFLGQKRRGPEGARKQLIGRSKSWPHGVSVVRLDHLPRAARLL